MTEGKLRSRRFRRVARKTPGGRVVIHYRPRKPSKPQCANCGKPLAGVPRTGPAGIRAVPKTQRRPERPFGGVLCSSCMRQAIRERVRKESGVKNV